MDVLKKLEEYRKNKVRNIDKCSVIANTDKEANEKLIPVSDLSTSMHFESTEDLMDDSVNCWKLTDFLYYGLCFILWCILYSIFIKLQFGTIFFIVSCLIGIYLNTRTSPKRSGEISAYSVFNKDCKSIDGTLTAEQFEREIRYGPSTMH